MNNYLDFLSEDIQTGLLKNMRVGMIRRTLKFIANSDGYKLFYNWCYLPECDPFILLNVKWWFE